MAVSNSMKDSKIALLGLTIIMLVLVFRVFGETLLEFASLNPSIISNYRIFTYNLTIDVTTTVKSPTSVRPLYRRGTNFDEDEIQPAVPPPRSVPITTATMTVKGPSSGRLIHLLLLTEPSARQDAIELCSVYSVAAHNPHRPVYVHHRFPLPERSLWLTLDNVIVRPINDSAVCAATPAASFYQQFLENHLRTSKHATVELSDILRLCIVYTMGGTYTDSDFIQIRPFNDGGGNFVLTEGEQIVNGMFDLDKGDGRLKALLAVLESGYKPGVWGSAGTQPFHRIISQNLTGIVKLPMSVVLPISYPEAVSMFLDPLYRERAMQRIQADPSTIGVHVYRGMLIWSGRKAYVEYTALAELIRAQCPPVYSRKFVPALVPIGGLRLEAKMEFAPKVIPSTNSSDVDEETKTVEREELDE